MKKKQSFSNLTLQKINLEADVLISNHLQDLDRISSDIKALEERLKNSAMPFTFYYILSSETRRYSGTAYHMIASYEERPYQAEFVEETDSCIVWGKAEDGQYRLLHNLYVTENEVDKYDDGNGQSGERVRATGASKLLSSRPLIETKSFFRLKIEEELVGFYTQIVEALKTKRDLDRIFEYSPNYNGFLPLAKVETHLLP